MNPDEGMKRLFDADEWNLTLPHRTLPERGRRMPLLIPAATVLAVAAVGVIVGLVFATGVRSPDIRPAVPVPSSSPSQTPSATPTPAAPVAPAVHDNVQGATCWSLLGTRYQQLVDEGNGFAEGYAENLATQPGQHFYDVIEQGGIVCGLANTPCCDVSLAYSWGPVAGNVAKAFRSELDDGDFTRTVENDITYYRWSAGDLTGGYAFWDGYWATAADNGGGDVLDDIVRNAPGSPLLQTDLYLTSEGMGDLRIGQPVPTSTTLVKWVGDYCGDYGGAWIATGDYENRFLVFTKDGTKTGKLIRIAVLSNYIPTKSGIRVGMSIDELEQTFPTFDDVILNIGNHYVIEGTNGEVSFDEAKGMSAPDGQIFSIQVIEIGAVPQNYESTDAGGNCPA